MRFNVGIDQHPAMTLSALWRKTTSAAGVHCSAVITGRCFRLGALLATGVLIVCPAFSQTFVSSLGGTVTDASGAVVQSAVVTATGVETGVATKTATNATGVYEFPSLQQGNYRVSAEAPGFKQYVYQRIVLDVGAQVRLNFKLELGSANTTVEVTSTAESPLLSTSAVVGGIVT